MGRISRDGFELRAVDDAYPLYGGFETIPASQSMRPLPRTIRRVIWRGQWRKIPARPAESECR